MEEYGGQEYTKSEKLIFSTFHTGYLGIIDGIYAKEIRIPSKPRPLKQTENGSELKKSGFSMLSE